MNYKNPNDGERVVIYEILHDGQLQPWRFTWKFGMWSSEKWNRCWIRVRVRHELPFVQMILRIKCRFQPTLAKAKEVARKKIRERGASAERILREVDAAMKSLIAFKEPPR